MLLDRNRSSAGGLLESLGLTASVLGGVREVESFDFLSSLPDVLSRDDFGTVLAAWSLDRAEEAGPHELSDRWRDKLMLSNTDRDSMSEVLEIVERLHSDWSVASVARQKRLAARRRFEAAVRLVSVSEPGLASEVLSTVDQLALTGLAPDPLLGGRDLIDAGFQAGPRFTEIIEAVYDAQLEGQVRTFEQALQLAGDLWGAS